MAHGFVLVVRCPGRSFHDTSRGTQGHHTELCSDSKTVFPNCARVNCIGFGVIVLGPLSIGVVASIWINFDIAGFYAFPSVRSRQSSWFLPLTCLEWSWHSCHAGGVVEELPEAERNQQKEPRVVADERCLGALCSLQSYLYWDNFRGAQDLGIMW